MYLTKCVSSFAEVAAQGPELAFVVYPEGILHLFYYLYNSFIRFEKLLNIKGISLMGVLAPVFSVLFFLMMISLGFGTEVSILYFIQYLIIKKTLI